ncbi:MAG: undecaprenyldiphospho-muramoylpentapeptide beta-N-acetylglucosaminyltransferase [Deltaproteobacteria bacterium]|nr:undecaprenyldiphospho-muramoylpentapeptide beta-N-acetylglucosaminyltransferase [Deltaproteobacteria bacterium]
MKVLIAGGGTGGHVFPALAVAQAIVAEPAGSQVLFAGTERGLEARAVPAAGFGLECVRVAGLKRMGWAGRLRGLALLPIAFVDSWRIISRFKPDVVLGVGGYASGPVVLCAWLRGVATAICEQNSVPGFTNRVLGRLVPAVLASFEVSRRYFAAERFHLVGNPVRAALIAPRPDTYADDPVRVLVLGGSQGARPLNERLPAGFALAFKQGQQFSIVHQAGPNDVDKVRAAYAGLGIVADVRGFIDDMAAVYAQTDLVIGRAGATTCAELTALGLPAVLIPFPQAADDHQTVNARALVDAGAAVLLPQSELTAERMAAVLAPLTMGDGAQLAQMADAARALGRPDAAAQVKTALERLVRGDRRW